MFKFVQKKITKSDHYLKIISLGHYYFLTQYLTFSDAFGSGSWLREGESFWESLILIVIMVICVSFLKYDYFYAF